MVQDGREAMLRAAAKYDSSSTASFRSWVVQCGVWAAVDGWRRRTHVRSVRGISFWPIPERHARFAEIDLFEQVDARLDACTQCARVVALIGELSSRDQDIIRGIAAGEPQKTIADDLGLDPTRVSQIVAKFRKTATTRLKETV